MFDCPVLSLTPAVVAEMDQAIARGCSWLAQVKSQMDRGGVEVVRLTDNETAALRNLPDALGAGEAQSIVVCAARKWIFLTNDKRARNYCREIGVPVIDLVGLLHPLWKEGICERRFVRELCTRMEAAEGMTIPNKEAIFRG